MVESDNVASYSQSHHSADHSGRYRDADPSDYSFDESLLKRRRRKLPIDRISSLPDSLLVHILSFLSIEAAIRTEVLSKRWLSIWTYVPSLIFYFSRGLPEDFVSFIDKTLLRCNCSKLKEFKINWMFMYYEPRFASNLNLWTRFAAMNGTEELHLELDGLTDKLDGDDRYVLPQLLFANSSFRELRFSFCSLVPTGVVCWKSLKKLSIGYMKLSDDLIQKILVGSPVLEILELYHFYGINRLHVSNVSVKKLILSQIWSGMTEDLNSELEISTPNLQSLEILGCFEEVHCRLVDVTSLVEVTLEFDNDLRYNEERIGCYERPVNTLRGLLKSLVNVKNITLGTWAIQVLSVMEAKGLRSPLLKNECLVLYMRSDIYKSDLPGMAKLFQSSPCLETLVINMSSSEDNEYFYRTLAELYTFDEKYYWTSQKRIFKCLMLNLKKVEFSGLRWCRPDCIFSFAKFLLKNAMMLQKMVIDMRREGSYIPMEVFQAAQKLLSFPRSSSDAIVVFYA